MSESHTADLATRYRYRQEGRELERERIIKLLEEQAEITGYVEIQLGKLIALIKGEQE